MLPWLHTCTHLSDSDVLELRGEREDSKEFDLAEGGLQQLVVRGNRVIRQVVVTGNATKVCHLCVGGGGEVICAWLQPIPMVISKAHHIPFICVSA